MSSPSFDAVIVGAGIVGTVAATLIREHRPQWRSLLVDRSLVGSGATAYSAGVATCLARSARHDRFSRDFYSRLSARRPDLPLTRLRTCCVVTSASLGRFVERYPEPAPAITTSDPVLGPLKRVLRWSDDEKVLLAGDSTYGLAGSVARHLAARFAATPHGDVWEGVEIRDAKPRDGDLALTCADGRELRARRVVWAVGPWVLAGPGAGPAVEGGIRIKKIVAFHVHERPPAGAPLVVFFDHDAFLLPLHERGYWLLSVRSEDWDCRPEPSSLSVDPEDRRIARSILKRYCPAWIDRCLGGRVFCDAYTPDGIPRVSNHETLPGLVLAGGASGSGFRLAPGIAAEALARWMPDCLFEERADAMPEL